MVVRHANLPLAESGRNQQQVIVAYLTSRAHRLRPMSHLQSCRAMLSRDKVAVGLYVIKL